MLYNLEEIVSILEADATLQTLLGGTATDKKIYPAIVDAFENFPCIVYRQIDGSFNTVPSNTAESIIQFNIYSRSEDQPKKEVEDIGVRINVLLNYYVSSQSGQRTIYLKEILRSDLNETDRRIFGKVLRYRLWLRN